MSIKIYDKALQTYVDAVPKIYVNGAWVEKDIKIKKNSSWSKVPELSDSSIPNLSTIHQDCIYKWGYYNLGKESKSSKLREVYMRFVNAYIHLDKYSTVKYNKYNSNDIISYSTPTGTYSYNGNSYPALRVYLRDISVSSEDVDLALGAFVMDNPGLLPKWCFCKVDGENSYYTNQKVNALLSTDISYILLPYYSASTINTYKNYLKSSFDLINAKIKQYYNIDYKDRGYYSNNKFYTAKQKAQIAKCIHDWLVYHNIYGSDTTPLDGNQEIWPAMSNGVNKPVCVSYAKAFTYCCWKWGITCIVCYGWSGENHAWNMYTVEPVTFYDSGFTNPSIWQDIDVTWGDTSSGNNYCTWKYFNRTTYFLFNNANHIRTYKGTSIYEDVDGVKHTITNGMTKSLPCDSTNIKYFFKDITVSTDETGAYVYAGFEDI